jgi:hypothetical protein
MEQNVSFSINRTVKSREIATNFKLLHNSTLSLRLTYMRKLDFELTK